MTKQEYLSKLSILIKVMIYLVVPKFNRIFVL